VDETERFICDEEAYRTMAQAGCPFGDGRAAEQIAYTLLDRL